jgi:hypothetical protein
MPPSLLSAGFTRRAGRMARGLEEGRWRRERRKSLPMTRTTR